MTALSRQRGSSVQRVTLKNGDVRWRFRLDLEPSADGKRRQQTVTCKTEAEAIALQAQGRTEVARGVYVEPDKRTLDDVLDGWLLAKAVRWKPSTRYVNESALKPVRASLGSRRVQQIRRLDIDRLVQELVRSGGRAQAGRSPRTVRIALQCLTAALALAVKDGTIPRNPAADIELPKATQSEREAWTPKQLAAFLAAVEDDPHAGLWHLTALGMRRGEVLGARWSDIDWEKRVIRIRQSRVLVGGETVAGTPKSDRSRRSVPLHEDAIRALKFTRDHGSSGAIVIPLKRAADRVIGVNALGEPLSPDWYAKRFHALVAAAGLPRIRLHDVRHSVATILLVAGQPVHVVAGVLGHDPAVLMRVYAHVTDTSAGAAIEALRVALGRR